MTAYCAVICPFRSLTCHIAGAEVRLFFFGGGWGRGVLILYPSIRQPMALQGSKGDIFAVWTGVQKVATFSTPVHTAKT